MKQIYEQRTMYGPALLFTLFGLVACGGKRSDQQIMQDVEAQLKAQRSGSRQAYANVSAAVKNGVVTLSGQCEGERCSDSAVARVKEIKGVKDVVAQLKETAPETDFTLRTSVQAVISKYQGVQADVAGGVVVLRGTIPRAQLQPLMNELSTLQARKIDNQLAIIQ